jgi:tetratricopeptide (TPR) repeat protein
MGGSGKSETAIKFVENNRESFWGIFWVNADTQDTAKQGFAEIASACSISNTSIEDVKSWLANKDSPWLLVLDNCDTMNKDYSLYFPSEKNGSIIMTTRLPECKSYGLSDDMHKLGPEASSSLLLRACGDKYQDRERHKVAAANVVKLVDELAIALVHAGAYIERGFCTLQEYPQRFQTQKKHAMQFSPVQMASRYGSVYTTFEISAEALSASGDKYDRLALTLLRILAFLDHEGVEEDIFKRALVYCQYLEQCFNTSPHVSEVSYDKQPSQLVSKEHGPAHGSRVKKLILRKMKSLFQRKPRSSAAVIPSKSTFIATVDEEPATGQKSCPVSVSETPSLSTKETSGHDADDGEIHHLSLWHCEEFRSTHFFDCNTLSDIEISRVRLAELSLIRVNNDKAISMHPLVHEWASIRLSTDEWKQAWSQTVCVLALSTEGERYWQTFTMSLQAHIETCFKDRDNIGYDDKIPLNLARGLYLLAWQLYRAENYLLSLELFHTIQRWCLLDTAHGRDLLYCEALCLSNIPGRMTEAVSSLKTVISVRLNYLGANNISTQQAQYALANCFLLQQNCQKAIDILEPMVTRFLAHVALFASGDEIAESKDAWSSIGNNERESENGHQVPCMLDSSETYIGSGKTTKAAPLLNEQITYRTSGLPSDDSLRLPSMHDLAFAYMLLGQNERALPYLEEVVRLRSQTLPPDDLERFNSVDVLARGYRSVDQLQKAINLRENALGLEHGFTLAHLSSAHSPWILKPVSEYRGKSTGRRERIQMGMMYNLAYDYLGTDQVLEAKALLEPVVEFASECYSLDDSERLVSMRALAITYARLGSSEELDGAIRLLEQVISNGEKYFESNSGLLAETEEWLNYARQGANFPDMPEENTTAEDPSRPDQEAEASDNDGRSL